MSTNWKTNVLQEKRFTFPGKTAEKKLKVESEGNGKKLRNDKIPDKRKTIDTTKQ